MTLTATVVTGAVRASAGLSVMGGLIVLDLDLFKPSLSNGQS